MNTIAVSGNLFDVLGVAPQVGEGVPAAWGDWAERRGHGETHTAVSLIEAGADVVVLRHPESLIRVKEAIDELMTAESA